MCYVITNKHFFIIILLIFLMDIILHFDYLKVSSEANPLLIYYCVFHLKKHVPQFVGILMQFTKDKENLHACIYSLFVRLQNKLLF